MAIITKILNKKEKNAKKQCGAASGGGAVSVSYGVATWSLVARVARAWLAPYARRMGGALLLMALAAAMTGAFAAILQPVIDDVLVAGDIGRVWRLAAMIFLIFFTGGMATYLSTVLMSRIGQSVVADAQRDLFSHFLALDLTFHHANPPGELLSRVMSDVEVMRTAVTSTLTGIGKSVLTLIALVAVMFVRDPFLALAAFTIFPPAALFVAWVGRRLRKMSRGIQTGQAELSARLSQIFQGIRLVKAYGMEAHECREAGAAIQRVRDLMFKAVRIANLSTPVNETLVGIVIFGIVVYGGYQVSAGATSAGALMSFIGAFVLSYEPMKKLARLNNTLQLGLGAAERIFDMLDTRPVLEERAAAEAVRFSRPEIVFSDVSFQYMDDARKALDRVSFTIGAGQVTALVGPSGSGKTTIMNLIPRFFDVTDGAVRIDGRDVRDMDLAALRQNIALVSQDVTIFDDTALANIAYGRAGASREDVIAAAQAAEADEFIRALPDGYDTRLGGEGLKLSGGQRQRIAIARAILRDAPILLLDEATSALDNEVERAIQKTLARVCEGRTTLVIAHRLSTVQEADRILVLEEGRLAEEGRHDALLAAGGAYARIYGGIIRK